MLIEIVFMLNLPGDLKEATGLGFDAALDKLALIETFGGDNFCFKVGFGESLTFLITTLDFGDRSVERPSFFRELSENSIEFLT